MDESLRAVSLSANKLALLGRWRQAGALSSDNSQIRPRGSSDLLPLSLAQQRLWFLHQFQPGTAAYNLFFCVRIDGHLDPVVLAESLTELVQRHEMLRTTFGLNAGGPCQTVHQEALVKLEVVDVRHLPGSDGMAAALERMDAAIHQPFDLEAGPLARMLLCRLEDQDVLGLVVHHLVADGWSLGVALRELSLIYQALSAGRGSPLADLPIQYGDFAVWQRENLSDENWASDLVYWRERLHNLAPLELPTDRPRPSIITPRGDWREFRLPLSLSEAVRKLAREQDSTLFMVLLTALTIVLHKLTGERDVAVGTAIANRTLPETFGLIGNFINMLVMRTSCDGDPAFSALLGRVRGTCLGAFAHQQVPFERVVEELQPERDLSRNVLFQVLFILQPPTTELRFAGMAMELIELGSRTSRADIELHLWDHPEIVGRLAFSSDLFEAATAELMLDRLRIVLSEAVNDPGRRLSALSLLSREEQSLLDSWGRGPSRDLSAVRVHEAVQQNAVRTPDATAVVFRDQRLSYRVLNSRANQLAHHLLSLGVGPDVPVAICLERSHEMLVALLGVLKAGGAYVPLDPRYPRERLALIAENAKAPVVVTEDSLAGVVPAGGALVVRIDRDRELIGSYPDVDPAVCVHPENLAYIIYTSGSTGTPKGVQIPHRALSNLVSSMQERPGIGPSDVEVTVASLSFDASVAELFPPLVAGACLVIASTDDVLDGKRLKSLILDNGVTILQATATIWLLLLEAGGLGDRRIKALCGGEVTTPDLARILVEAHDSAWNMYGPTETTVWSSAYRIQPPGLVSLGQPLANTQLHVVDDYLRQVPIGVVGELCIGGAGLSRGYLGSAALTADRFMPDPFTAERGKRLYRTGDLARYRSDGTLEFSGRRDQQIKLRGHRIELGEIEATLSEHQAVERAVVVRREASPGNARLIAYIVPPPAGDERDKARTAEMLSAHARKWLPEYMIPSAYVFLDTFPTTPSGKVNRLCLPPPETKRPEIERDYVPPTTPLEREICSLTAQLLELERVGISDDFFELGGHSLLAAQLVGELRQRYGVDLLLQELFNTPTVQGLAKVIDEELARKRHLSDQETRMRHVVDKMPQNAVDTLLERLMAQAAARS